MNTSVYVRLIILLSFFSISALAQTDYEIHSHNDYEQEFPFWNAYVNGLESIEIDVFLRKDALYVTHAETEILPANSIENLYLDPLSALAKNGKLREVQILIDVKSDPYKTLEKLVKTIENRPELAKNQNLHFVISGNRPKPSEYKNYPDFIQFDHQSLDDLNSIDLKKVALVSASFSGYSVWNGLGRMTEADLVKVKTAIEKAHSVNKPFRFWAAPDTKTAWSLFAALGVDYINTDHPAQAAKYLATLKERTFAIENPIAVYKPKYEYDKETTPKNVILLIGDGNGLSQISAAQIANGGSLTVTQLKDLGLVKTASFDDLVTDSAAGATAMATGKKTNNRAIGTDPEGKKLKNLTEILAQHNFINGLLTTDNITGATPSAFYAHTPERDDSAGILDNLNKSQISFFMAGGKEYTETIKKAFKVQKMTDFNQLSGKTAVFIGDEKVESIENGRGDLFPQSVKKALNVLSNQQKPFFLMIEGAQIDSNGHTNNVSGIVQEVLDFDQTIAEALKIADTTENTLVIITADHETSGFGILQGSLENHKIEGGFLTNDHTATMVPLFAYGPQAQHFQGVYENTAIFEKILEALKIESIEK